MRALDHIVPCVGVMAVVTVSSILPGQNSTAIAAAVTLYLPFCPFLLSAVCPSTVLYFDLQ